MTRKLEPFDELRTLQTAAQSSIPAIVERTGIQKTKLDRLFRGYNPRLSIDEIVSVRKHLVDTIRANVCEVEA